jgi:hypothetical protein
MRISDLHRRILAQSQPLLLDLFPNASAAYSLRKLRTAYTGNCIEVRRSSDNATQNIGFVNNVLDTASLLSFVGAGDGFVRTWYDQSGSARNATQTTNANQPRIVNSGVLDSQNTKGSLFFDGTDRLTLPDFALPTSSIFSAAITTGTSPSSLDVHTIYARGNGTIPSSVSRDAFLYVWRSNNRVEIQRSNSSVFPTAVKAITASNFNLLTGIYTGTQLIAYGNSVAGTPVNTTISGSTSPQISSIGCVFENAQTVVINYLFVGRISEIIVYNSDQSTNRTAIETNINSFYNIY